jgi:hypothetical protein
MVMQDESEELIEEAVKSEGTASGISENVAAEVSIIYPNPLPSGQLLNISLNETNATDRSDITIYNAIGEIVFNKTFSGQQTTIETNFESGHYNVVIKTGDDTIYKKLTVTD